MDTYPPFRGRGFGFGPVVLHQGGPDALAWATFALVLLLVLLVGVLLVARLARRPRREFGFGQMAFAGPPGPGPRHDPLELLRWRYARGEISHDEFVQSLSDLAPTVEQPPG